MFKAPFTLLALLSASISCFAQVDWEGRKSEVPLERKCEAGFIDVVKLNIPEGWVSPQMYAFNTIMPPPPEPHKLNCVPTKQLIDTLINKLAEAAVAMRETRTTLHNVKEEVARLTIVVDILDQENSALYARLNSQVPVKKEKK